jgi:aminoglycoside phosphotransferase (APT) family kinase protein
MGVLMGIWWSAQEVAASIDALQRARLVERETELSVLGEGFGSVALQSQSGIVVLVCKNVIGAEARRVSTSLLPDLAPLLPVQVPEPQWSTDVADGLPWGAWAYRKLPGRLMTRADGLAHADSLAGQLAAILLALHSFPPDIASGLGVPSREWLWELLRRVRSEIDGTLRSRLAGHEYSKVQTWWDAFMTDRALLTAPAALVHGDLWPENMLVSEDGAEIRGVIDWGNAAVLDIAYDFAPLEHVAGTLAEMVASAYQDGAAAKDKTFEHRVRRYRELRGSSVFGFWASVRENDAEELEDCINKLRQSRVLRT